MIKTKKADNPELQRDYLHEAGVELRGSEGEHSYAPASAEGEDKSTVNTSNLLDRILQQAIAQVLSPIFEKEFSDFSYGFRPGRNAHQAIKQAEAYINEGYGTVVDIDLEKFFDRVNHDKLMYLTKRSDGKSMARKIVKLNQVITGWVNYYHLADMESFCQELDGWIRRRLRMCFWKQWKKIRNKHDNLTRLGIPEFKAYEFANTRKGYWHTANSPILSRSVTDNYLRSLGLVSLSEVYKRSLSLRTAVCRTARTVV